MPNTRHGAFVLESAELQLGPGELLAELLQSALSLPDLLLQLVIVLPHVLVVSRDLLEELVVLLEVRDGTPVSNRVLLQPRPPVSLYGEVSSQLGYLVLGLRDLPREGVVFCLGSSVLLLRLSLTAV